jgi:hypothetical protein
MKWIWILVLVTGISGPLLSVNMADGKNPPYPMKKGAEVCIAKPGDDLAEVSKKLHAGDTLLLRGGVYYISESGQIRPNASGESWEKPITIAAYPGEKPILDGTFVLDGKWEKCRDEIYSLDLQVAGYEKPGNVRFSHSTKGYPVSPVYMEILWQDGPPGEGKPVVHQIALSMESGNEVYPQERLDSFFSIYGRGLGAVDEPGEFYYSPDEHKLYIRLHDGDNPNKHVIRAPYGARTSLIGLSNKEYYIIRELTLRGSAGSGIYTRGINHFRLENTEISYMGGQLSLGNDVAIRSCCFHHGFYNVAQGTGEGFVFEGNEVHHMGDRDTWGYGIIGGETYGLNLSNGHHQVIRSNYFHDNVIGENGYGGGAIVQETWGRREGQPQQERTHHIVYENNVFENCGYGLIISGRDTTHHHVIRHNVFRNFTRSAIRIAGDNQDHLISENIFVDSRDPAIRILGGGKSRYIASSEPYPYHPVGNTIKGNILIGDEVSFERGAQAESNEVTDNTTLPQKEYTLQELINMSMDMGADFSNVPVIGR